MSALGNQFKTVLLLGVLTALLLFVGQLVGGMNGLLVGLVFAVVMNLFSYLFSDRIVLAMYRAKPADKKDYPVLHRIAEEVAQLAEIPKPKLYIINNPTPNAFATGRGPKKSA
ncbi:protease HtpX, partial [Candidatus Woesearchaeota archaeon CG08_land_8_20_14_0_20_43_7]